MQGNVIDYEAIGTSLGTIKSSSEDTQSSLNSIDSLIQTAVGADGAAWSGDSAVAFRNSWDELAGSIPEFIATVQKQVTNLETMLEKQKAADTSEVGTVNQ